MRKNKEVMVNEKICVLRMIECIEKCALMFFRLMSMNAH